jgi:hypothetical protein
MQLGYFAGCEWSAETILKIFFQVHAQLWIHASSRSDSSWSLSTPRSNIASRPAYSRALVVSYLRCEH